MSCSGRNYEIPCMNTQWSDKRILLIEKEMENALYVIVDDKEEINDLHSV